jgi:hypothetical protein
MLANGMASAHRVDLSMTVRMYCMPLLDVGRGPTKSMWMWVNLLVGTGMGSTAAASCLVTLARAQCWQSRHHAVISRANPGHR